MGGRVGGWITYLFFPFRHLGVVPQVDRTKLLGEVPLAGFRDGVNPGFVEVLLGR